MRPPRWLVGAVAGLVAAGSIGGFAIAKKSESSSRRDNAAAENAAALQRVADLQRAARLANPEWWKHNALPPISSWRKWSIRPRPRDRVAEGSTPYPSQLYDMEGRDYQHWQNGWATLVEAGAFRANERQGILIVRDAPYPLRISLVPRRGALDAPDRSRITIYRSPLKLGKLHIVDAHRQVLTLVTRIGHKRLLFDVRTRRFSLTPLR
jgi:hypothetical protein